MVENAILINYSIGYGQNENDIFYRPHFILLKTYDPRQTSAKNIHRF